MLIDKIPIEILDIMLNKASVESAYNYAKVCEMAGKPLTKELNELIDMSANITQLFALSLIKQMEEHENIMKIASEQKEK